LCTSILDFDPFLTMPGREEVDTELGTYSDDLPDDDLVEDDEIDDELVLHQTGPMSTSDHPARHNGDSKDDLKVNSSSRHHASEHLGRSVHRRPPRPTHSGGLGNRKPIRGGGGSVSRKRTTRRVAAAEKHWGNASMPAITVRDIMGSEKKATSVGMTGSDHSRPKGIASPVNAKSGAEQKRSMIRSRFNEKRDRQSNVKNSLAQFLSGDQSEDSDGELEDEEIISDNDEAFNGHGSTQSLNLDHLEDSDDGRSVKSSRSHGRRPRRSSAKRTDGNMTDGDAPGSPHSISLSRNSRRRQRKSDGGDDDDKSIGSTRSRSRMATRRPSKPEGEEISAVETSDKEQMRRTRNPDHGQKKTRSSSAPRRAAPSKSRSTPTRKKSSGGDDDDRSVGSRKAVGTRRRKTTNGDDDDRSVGSRKTGRRRKPPVDDDDRSVGSKKSVGGRRRRQQSQRTKKSAPASHDDVPESLKPRVAKLESGTPPVSPLGSRPNSASSIVEGSDKLTSLSHHIEANPLLKCATDPEERSEESSRFSANYEQQQSLLQFDPTNANNITMVRQDKAHITSEKFRHSDGKETEFHIAELAGLPTFETQPTNFDDSQNSGMSEAEKRPASARSVGSYASDGETLKAAKSMSHIGYNHNGAGTAQKARQKSQEGVSPGNTAGRLRGVTGSRSFLARRRKPDNNVKIPGAAVQESTFQESMKGFFGTWNKKGECESGDEEEDQPKGSRFFRKREDVEHQALDDDGSDEN
jgi:hypothetical protein